MKTETLKAKMTEADVNRMVLSPEKIVFILGDGVTAEATMFDKDLRSLIVSGMGYAEWPSHQKAAVYAIDQNKTWKFIK